MILIFSTQKNISQEITVYSYHFSLYGIYTPKPQKFADYWPQTEK